MRPRLAVRWLGVPRRNDLLLQALDRFYAVEETADAEVAFCGEGVPASAASPDAVTFFVPTELWWPPLAQYDYSFGFLHLQAPRYRRLPNYALEHAAAALIKPPDFAEQVLDERREFCSFVVSNGNPRRTFQRIYFFQALHAQRRVSSGGRMFNNCGPLPPDFNALDDFIRRHRMHIAIENKAWRGYCTEKIASAMAAGAIPLYWGDPSVEQDFNPASFVHLRHFPDLLAARDHVLRLADDRDAQARLLREPWFHGNRPNAAYDLDTLAEFLRHSISRGRQSKRRLFPVTWAHKNWEKLSGRVANLHYRLRAPALPLLPVPAAR